MERFNTLYVLYLHCVRLLIADQSRVCSFSGQLEEKSRGYSRAIDKKQIENSIYCNEDTDHCKSEETDHVLHLCIELPFSYLNCLLSIEFCSGHVRKIKIQQQLVL